MSSNGEINSENPELIVQELETFPTGAEEFSAEQEKLAKEIEAQEAEWIEEQQKLAEEAEAKRLEAEKEVAEREEANEKAEAEALAANQVEDQERAEAARAFDWDAWEKETDLTRPEEVK